MILTVKCETYFKTYPDLTISVPFSQITLKNNNNKKKDPI